MIYIEKRKPEKVILDKIAEIKNSMDWKTADSENTELIRQCFDQLPKDGIRKSLLKEQHGLCAYCMKRITDSSLEMTIEHWYPLSKDKERALDYGNMLGVCKGGSSVQLGEGEKRELCCDAYKGDEEIKINPLEKTHMRQVKYTKEGKIYTDDALLNRDLNEKLRLNGILHEDGTLKCDTSTGLVKGRRDAYKQYETMVKSMCKRGKLTSSAIRKQIENIKSEETMKEFAGVLIFFLERKCRILSAQENNRK